MRPLLIAAVVALATPAAAWDDMQRVQTATALGGVLAAEEACDLSYDQDAITAYIEKTVPADDMEFPGALTLMVSGTAYQLESMSPSQKTAHCTQIRRVAKSYGFTP